MSCQWPMWELVFAVFVNNLGSDQYRTRETASATLQQLAPLITQRLAAAERSADREVATRARQILDRYFEENASAWAGATLPKDYPHLPWMADLPTEFADGLSAHYLQRARRQVGMHGPPDWYDYRLATRLLVEDMYRQRVPRERIILILNQLAEVERDWQLHHKGRP